MPAIKPGIFAWCSPLLFVCGLAAQPALPKDEQIIVTATRHPLAITATPAAVDVVDAEKLRTMLPTVDLSEFLSRVPGLHIQNRQNYAQDTQISARGFGARATFGIRGIKIFVDDIPVTLPDGQAQGAIIPLAVVGKMEVLRGPWAVAYGNAAGGVIAAETVRPSPMLSARMLRGAHGLRVDSVLAAAAGGSFSHQRLVTEGFRAHSRSLREHSYLRLDTSFASSAQLRLTANVIEQPNSQDPLGLTRQQVEQNPRQAGSNAALFDTRKSISHRQFGAVWSNDFADIHAKVIAYTGERHVTQFLATPVVAQAAPASAGGVIDLSRDFGGVGVRLARQGAVAWSVGVDWDAATDTRRGYKNFVRTGTQVQTGVRGNVRRDESNTQRGVDVFGQASVALGGDWHNWHTHLGARHSRLNFAVRDHYIRAGNGDDSGGRAFAAFSPAVGLVRMQNEAGVKSSVYLSAAQGFETPTAAEMAYRQDQASGLNLDLQASRNRQLEIGWRRQAATCHASLSAFFIQSQNEIVPSVVQAGRSSFQNAAGTERRGVEASLVWRAHSQWEATLAWTWMRAVVADAYTAGGTRTIAAGAMLPAVPRHNLFAEVAWRRNLPGLSATMTLQARSTLPADDANTAFAAGYAMLAAALNYRHVAMLGTQPVELDGFVRMDNLLDQKYIGSVIANEANQRYFEPSPGHHVMLGLSARWRF